MPPITEWLNNTGPYLNILGSPTKTLHYIEFMQHCVYESVLGPNPMVQDGFISQ